MPQVTKKKKTVITDYTKRMFGFRDQQESQNT